MKKTFILTIILILCSAGLSNAVAQPRKPTAEQKEQFLLAKLKLIQQELKLTEEQTNKFAPIYRKYNDEMSQIFENSLQKEQSMPKETVHDATAVVNQRIAMKMSLLKLQKAYYAKFSKILTANQMLRVEDAERKIQFQIMSRHDRKHKDKRPPRPRPIP